MRHRAATSWLATLILALFVGTAGEARAEPNCTCRYAGQSFALNTCVCITTSSGSQRACCGRVLNNTSWKFTGDACPVASTPTGGKSPELAEASLSSPAEHAKTLDDPSRD